MICSVCKQEKPRNHKKSGRCVECARVKNHENYIKNIERYKEQAKKWTESNPEKVREAKYKWRKNNPEYWKNYNSEVKKYISEKYRRNNLEYYAEKSSQRNRVGIAATPKCVDEDEKFLILEVYHLAKIRTEITGIKWEVDHIIPLQHKEVCGLHTIHNLQVITQAENRKKSNKFSNRGI